MLRVLPGRRPLRKGHLETNCKFKLKKSKRTLLGRKCQQAQRCVTDQGMAGLGTKLQRGSGLACGSCSSTDALRHWDPAPWAPKKIEMIRAISQKDSVATLRDAFIHLSHTP